MSLTRAIDLAVIAIYFAALAGMGWYFRRPTGTTEQSYIGGRAYPGWRLGVELQFLPHPQQSDPGKAMRDEIVRAVKPLNRERMLQALRSGETRPG